MRDRSDLDSDGIQEGRPPARWIAQLEARFQSREVWFAFGLAYLISSSFNFYSFSQRPGWLAQPESWIICWGSPWIWLGGICWFSPLPWQMARETGRGAWLRAAGLAFLFSEGWQAFSLLPDLLLYHLAGIQIPGARVLIYTLAFPGPLMFLAGYLISRYEAAERGRVAALARAQEAQVRLLQSQMNPHVLFNSLNALAELIVKDPLAAEESVRALSDLLRRLLEAWQAPLIPLREERAMVESYLSLEALRLGPRLGVSWQWDVALEEAQVPPLTLQPLVENAVKHGLAPSRRGGQLEIRLAREAEDLVMAVRNTGEPAPESQARGFGIGLRNLRERLGLMYGPRATLDLRSRSGWTEAEVRIQGFQLPS